MVWFSRVSDGLGKEISAEGQAALVAPQAAAALRAVLRLSPAAARLFAVGAARLMATSDLTQEAQRAAYQQQVHKLLQTLEHQQLPAHVASLPVPANALEEHFVRAVEDGDISLELWSGCVAVAGELQTAYWTDFKSLIASKSWSARLCAATWLLSEQLAPMSQSLHGHEQLFIENAPALAMPQSVFTSLGAAGDGAPAALAFCVKVSLPKKAMRMVAHGWSAVMHQLQCHAVKDVERRPPIELLYLERDEVLNLDSLKLFGESWHECVRDTNFFTEQLSAKAPLFVLLCTRELMEFARASVEERLGLEAIQIRRTARVQKSQVRARGRAAFCEALSADSALAPKFVSLLISKMTRDATKVMLLSQAQFLDKYGSSINEEHAERFYIHWIADDPFRVLRDPRRRPWERPRNGVLSLNRFMAPSQCQRSGGKKCVDCLRRWTWGDVLNAPVSNSTRALVMQGQNFDLQDLASLRRFVTDKHRFPNLTSIDLSWSCPSLTHQEVETALNLPPDIRLKVQGCLPAKTCRAAHELHGTPTDPLSTITSAVLNRSGARRGP